MLPMQAEEAALHTTVSELKVALGTGAAKRRQKVIQNTPPNWQGSIGVDKGHDSEGLRPTGHVRFPNRTCSSADFGVRKYRHALGMSAGHVHIVRGNAWPVPD